MDFVGDPSQANASTPMGAAVMPAPDAAGMVIPAVTDSLSIDTTMPQVPVRISVLLPTNAYFTSGIREFCIAIAKNMSGFSDQWAYRFQSVVDELINNAIEFGSRPGEEIRITFMSMEKEYVEVFVEDNGTGIGGKTAADIMAFVQKQAEVDPNTLTSIRGRGLAQIVSKWTDTLEFLQNDHGGITAHVIKRFQADEAMVIPV